MLSLAWLILFCCFLPSSRAEVNTVDAFSQLEHALLSLEVLKPSFAFSDHHERLAASLRRLSKLVSGCTCSCEAYEEGEDTLKTSVLRYSSSSSSPTSLSPSSFPSSSAPSSSPSSSASSSPTSSAPSSSPTSSIVPPSLEREVLMQLYNITNGDFWFNNTGWGTNSSACKWHGVTCDETTSHINSLILNTNNLVGQIPADLGSLVGLTSLELRDNSLSAGIPDSLSALISLTNLDLNNNVLKAQLSSSCSVFKLTNLISLDIGTNGLTGEIPAELGYLSKLTFLDLALNNLQGQIPQEFARLTELQNLLLTSNQFSGSIPASFGNLTNLDYLDLSSNSFGGAIPSEIGNLLELTLLDLALNQLHGNIPSSLGSLTNLVELFLDSNHLEGEIPSELGSLLQLNDLSLSENRLTGEIPVSLGNLSSLEFLYLSTNNLVGQIPTELGSLSSLTYLDLSNNFLVGSIPSSLGALTDLEALILYSNVLNGTLPEELSNFVALTSLDVSLNQIHGKIPPNFSQLTRLKKLYLASNQFSGTIPVGLGKLSSLVYVSFASNRFFQVPQFTAPIAYLNLSVNAIQSLDFVLNASVLDVSYNPISSVSQAFWTSPNLHSLTMKSIDFSEGLAKLAPPSFASSPNMQIRELTLAHNSIGDWQAFFKTFDGILLSSNFNTLDLRNCNLTGQMDLIPSFQKLNYIDLGENPALVRSCSDAAGFWSQFETQHNLQFLRIDSTGICIDDFSFRYWSPLQILDLSHSPSCMTNAMLQLQDLISIKWYDINKTHCAIDSSLLVDNPSRTTLFSERNNLICPQRQTLFGGVVESDVAFLNYRNCSCQPGSYWNWESKLCIKCNSHLICDSRVNGTEHAIIGPYYPLYQGQLAARWQYPEANLQQCETSATCNPNCLAAVSCVATSFMVCGEGRDVSSRMCSRCQSGWFTLSTKCIKCEPSYPYLVVILLPLCLILVAAYLWAVASSPAQQALAGLSICTFGFQLMSVIDSFFPPNTDLGGSSGSSLALPTFMIILQQAANFRPWSLECINSRVNFEVYFYIKLLSPLFGLILVAIAQRHSFERYRARIWFVLCYFLDLAYFPLCVVCLQLFQCDEDGFFDNVPYLSCPRSVLMRVVAVVGFLLYGFGIPVWFGSVLWSHKDDLEASEMFYLRFLVDTLHTSSDSSVALWPIWKLGRRLLLAVVITLISRHSSSLPLALCLMLIVSAVVHLQTLPYRSKLDNGLELFVSIGCGIMYLVSMLQAGFTEYGDLSTLRIVLTYGILIVLFLGVALHVCVPIIEFIREKTSGLSLPLLRPPSIQDEKSSFT